MNHSTKYALIGSIATGLLLPTTVSADTIKRAVDNQQEQSGDFILKQDNEVATDKDIKAPKSDIHHENKKILKNTVTAPSKSTKK